MCVMLFMALIASLIAFVVPFIKAWFERFLGLVYNVLFRPLSPISIFCFVSTFLSLLEIFCNIHQVNVISLIVHPPPQVCRCLSTVFSLLALFVNFW